MASKLSKIKRLEDLAHKEDGYKIKVIRSDGPELSAEEIKKLEKEHSDLGVTFLYVSRAGIESN